MQLADAEISCKNGRHDTRRNTTQDRLQSTRHRPLDELAKPGGLFHLIHGRGAGFDIAENGKLLVVAGAWLFLLGLLQGVAVPLFGNPRMGLSAHLTAVQSGMALMILGAVWANAMWSPSWEKLSLRSSIAGMYGLWFGLTLAAVTRASESLPIAGQGHHAGKTAEFVVSVFVIGSSGLMIVGWSLFLRAILRPKV